MCPPTVLIPRTRSSGLFAALVARNPHAAYPGTTSATTCGMSYRHVVGRSKFINKIIGLSKWHPPPCTPDIYLLSAHISRTRVGRLSPHWVHCVLLGFAPHYVAVQPGRCRRFIGTLLARIKYTPRTLRMDHKETKKRKSYC